MEEKKTSIDFDFKPLPELKFDEGISVEFDSESIDSVDGFEGGEGEEEKVSHTRNFSLQKSYTSILIKPELIKNKWKKDNKEIMAMYDQQVVVKLLRLLEIFATTAIKSKQFNKLVLRLM